MYKLGQYDLLVGVAETTEPIKESDLQQWKVVERFRARLEGQTLLSARPSTWSDPRRTLSLSRYLSLFLFALVNPALNTVRAIHQATQLQRVQREISGGPVSLGSFSEAQHLVEPAFLAKVFQDLAWGSQGPPPQNPREANLQWLAQDSTLWRALPRMDWALYGGGRGPDNRAVRLHLSFNVIEDQTAAAAITTGKTCERKAWRSQWEPGASYIGDRYYGEDYSLFGQLEELGCHYIIRLRDEAVINVEEELALSAEDVASAVTRQAWARLGAGNRRPSARLRVVWLQKPGGETMRLAANLAPAQLSAALAARLYKKRWQVEFFFRWIKTILPSGHWLAESSAGAALQLYLVVIAAVLLHQALGVRPNKRMMELLHLYQMGWATLDELEAGLQRQKELVERQNSASKIR